MAVGTTVPSLYAVTHKERTLFLEDLMAAFIIHYWQLACKLAKLRGGGTETVKWWDHAKPNILQNGTWMSQKGKLWRALFIFFLVGVGIVNTIPVEVQTCSLHGPYGRERLSVLSTMVRLPCWSRHCCFLYWPLLWKAASPLPFHCPGSSGRSSDERVVLVGNRLEGDGGWGGTGNRQWART